MFRNIFLNLYVSPFCQHLSSNQKNKSSSNYEIYEKYRTAYRNPFVVTVSRRTYRPLYSAATAGRGLARISDGGSGKFFSDTPGGASFLRRFGAHLKSRHHDAAGAAPLQPCGGALVSRRLRNQLHARCRA